MEIQLLVLKFVFIFIRSVTCADSNEWSEQDVNATKLPRLPMPEFWNSDIPNLLGPRIIGGSPVRLGEFRGIVSIQTSRGNSHFCGGTLISENHVLTAAHCVVNDVGTVAHPNLIAVMADDVSINRFKISPKRQIRHAELIFAHPNYSLRTLRNDIAVLRVKPPFQISDTFAPVNVSSLTPLDNYTCYTAGWGATVENGTVSSHLLGTNLTVVPKNLCNSKKSYGGMIKSNMFCAGSMDGGKDSCQGDSGGGLICDNLLSGVVSFGLGCGRKHFPGVYTDVSKYIHWINSTIMWNDTQNPPIPTTVKPSGSEKLTSFSKHFLLTFFILISSRTIFRF